MASAGTLVWLVDADALDAAALASYAGWLGASEQVRCARFVRAGRRRQFIVGRALLRLALGRLLGVSPEGIALTERPGQAPLLASPRFAGFSISHSGRWVACGASLETALGLDIERIDPARDVMALAQQAFPAHDVDLLQACAPDALHATFYRMWCRHEARIKLGVTANMEYPVHIPGLAGMLACAAPLDAAPALALVRLQDL